MARVVEMVPVLFVLVLGSAVALGALAAVAGLRPFASPWESRLFVLLLLIVAVAAGRLLWTRRVLLPTTRLPLGPSLPGLVLMGYAVAARVLPPGHRAEWFLGGDHVRHLMFVVEEQGAGNLSYSSQAYPRAWHTLLAALWTSTGARPDSAGLRSLVDLMATATWCLPAVLSIATGLLAVELVRCLGRPDAMAGVAGLGAAAMVLWPPFLSNYQALGFENSLVGGIVLAVAAREVVARAGSGTWAAVLALASIVVCAHTWQLLLPPLGVAFLFLAWQTMRSGGWRRLGGGHLAVGGLVAAAVAMPALLAVFTVIGVQHATDAGVEAPLPMALLLAGLACSTVLMLRHRDRPSLILLWLMTILPGATAIAVATTVGIGLTQYYPSKLLWHSAVLGLAPLAVVVVGAWWRLEKRHSAAVVQVARPAGVAAGALAVAFALVTPSGAFVGAWSTVRGAIVLEAATSPRAREAQVVWLGTIGDDTIGRILLDFYRAGQTQERTPQPPLDVGEECRLLEASGRPAVLSTQPADAVRARYPCALDLTLIRVAP